MGALGQHRHFVIILLLGRPSVYVAHHDGVQMDPKTLANFSELKLELDLLLSESKTLAALTRAAISSLSRRASRF